MIPISVMVQSLGVLLPLFPDGRRFIQLASWWFVFGFPWEGMISGLKFPIDQNTWLLGQPSAIQIHGLDGLGKVINAAKLMVDVNTRMESSPPGWHEPFLVSGISN